MDNSKLILILGGKQVCVSPSSRPLETKEKSKLKFLELCQYLIDFKDKIRQFACIFSEKNILDFKSTSTFEFGEGIPYSLLSVLTRQHRPQRVPENTGLPG